MVHKSGKVTFQIKTEWQLCIDQVVSLEAPGEALSQIAWFVLTMVAGNLVLPTLLLPLVLVILVR